MDRLLIRYDEMTLKSRRKRRFFNLCFKRSVVSALKKTGIEDYRLELCDNRLIVHTDSAEELIPLFQRIPGIHSVSPVLKIPFKTLDEIVESLPQECLDYVADCSYAVRVKRSGEHPFRSMDVGARVGGALKSETNWVNLSKPEKTVYLEVRDDVCYLFYDNYAGMGGLPIASGGKVLSLFSGGLDSPVAFYQMLKRGVCVNSLFFNMEGDVTFSEALSVYNYLISNYAHGYKPVLFVVEAKEMVEKLREEIPSNMRQLALKIIFYQVAQKICERSSHMALLTGESANQKSSQTLQSLCFIEKQVDIPVMRPLVGMNKDEITAIAEKIGTADYSKHVKEVCNLSEGPVITLPKPHHMERLGDLEPYVQMCIENISRFVGEVELPEINNQLPQLSSLNELIVVDMRYQFSQSNFPLFTDIQLSQFGKVEDADPTKTYLFVCEYNVRSRAHAYRIRKNGGNAAGISQKQYKQYFEKLIIARSRSGQVLQEV
ncbi:MAG: tRNA sulfurtransferase [Chlamydiia bacterium]|nr:tRNA sulfurtransferase [Chlamydiia bacterium]